jgi:Protein of unknown function (DUF3298)/Deacetylase PdaC
MKNEMLSQTVCSGRSVVNTVARCLCLLLVLPFTSEAQTSERLYRGTVGRSAVTMKLKREGDRLSGSYSYDRIKQDIPLKGSLDREGNVMLQEFGDSTGHATASFKGKLEENGYLLLPVISGEWTKTGSAKPLEFSLMELQVDPGLTVTTGSFVDNKLKTLSLESKWPQFAGSANPNLAAFNRLLKTEAAKRVTAFRAEYKANRAGKENWGYYESFDVTLVSDRVASVLMTAGPYTGGAHDGYEAYGYNFDLRSGRELKLADLFKPGAGFLQLISKSSEADLKKREGLFEDSLKEGVAPKAENFQTWVVTRNGVVFVIEPYRVGPWAAGPQFVTVPFSVLKGIIRPDGPLAALAK